MYKYNTEKQTQRDALVIEDYKNSCTLLSELAKKFGVNRVTIKNILKRNNISHIRNFRKSPYSEEFQQKVIKYYLICQSSIKTSIHFKISRPSVLNILKRHKIDALNKTERINGVLEKFSKEIIEDFKINKDVDSLSGKFNIKEFQIRRFLDKNGVLKDKKLGGNRKFYCNFNYFTSIDTEKKAYYAGLIAADGNISKKGNTVSVYLHKNDVELLIKMKNDLDSNYHPTFSSALSKGKPCLMSLWQINSKQIKNDLIKIGLIPNKTGKLNWSLIEKNIPHDLLRHFIRGFFDGDGHFGRCLKTQSILFGISEKGGFYLQGIKKFFNENGLNSKSKIFRNKQGVDVYSVGGRNKLAKIYEILYKDSTVSMDRKRKIIEDYLFLFKVF